MSGRILAIDDIDTNLDLLARYLQRSNYNVTTCLSAIAAEELLKNQEFDLILCDMMMPEVDGLTFLRRLKTIEAWKDIPLIMISALDEIETVAEAIEAGAEDYLLKPFNQTLLKARVISCLEKKTFRDREKQYLAVIKNDLSAAAKLQESILPHSWPPHPMIDLYAYIQPAAEVGGDFYDYFWITPTKLGVVMADVSGKGLTGALFMTMARTLIKAYAKSYPEPQLCLAAVNDIIAEQNERMMFVTTFYAVIDIESNVINYVNAGHCPGVLCHDDQMILLDKPSGMPLGTLENAEYIAHQHSFLPSYQLFLHTDGVNEAMNLEYQLYDYHNLYNSINQTNKNAPIKDQVTQILDQLKAFVNGADQSDDITCMLIQYQKNPSLSIKIENKLTNILPATEKIKNICKYFGVDNDNFYSIDLSLDELLTNIINYAYTDSQVHEITIKISDLGSAVAMEIIDDGAPFDPTKAPPADTISSLENRRIGGLGIQFVKTFAARMRYHHWHGRNHVVIEFEKQ